MANILQSLVHTERNQQVMCEAGLHARLLQRCSAALADEDHALHPPLQRMFERLASQALEPMVLRSVVPFFTFQYPQLVTAIPRAFICKSPCFNRRIFIQVSVGKTNGQQKWAKCSKNSTHQ